MLAWSKPITVVVALLLAVSLAAQLQPAKRPNIVFLLADDLGVMDLGAYNPKTFYATPNLDALARSGMRFTCGYSACPVCSPTRASIMTGKYPVRTGITDFIGAQQDRKSTRLNSSHLGISYAVFSLKKNNFNGSSRKSALSLR